MLQPVCERVAVGTDAGVPVEMAYFDSGDESAEYTCLLLHGLFDNKGTWSGIRGRFDDRFRLIAPDLVGFGYSSKPEFADVAESDRYSVAMLADFVREFVRVLELDNLILVGSSLGGGIGLKLMLDEWRQGPSLRGLILIDAAGYPQPLPGHIQLLTGWPGALLTRNPTAWLAMRLGVVAAIVRGVFERVFYDRQKIPRDLVAASIEILELEGSLAASRWAARNVFPADVDSFGERFREIAYPTLIIWGRDDRIVPPLSALRFEADIARSKLHVFDECGHAPQLEYPDETAAVIRDWARNNL